MPRQMKQELWPSVNGILSGHKVQHLNSPEETINQERKKNKGEEGGSRRNNNKVSHKKKISHRNFFLNTEKPKKEKAVRLREETSVAAKMN